MDFGLVGNISRRLTDLPAGITCIDTGYIRPGLAACYLVEEKGEVAIIETGTAYSVSIIADVLKLKNIQDQDVKYIMPTHVHLDHAGGAGHLVQRFPSAQLVIHPRGARHMLDPDKLWQGSMDVYGAEAMQRLYGEVLPVEESRMLIAEDGYRLELSGRPLLFLDTPGHARHHYSVFDERSNGFFTGDTFGMAYQQLLTRKGPYIMPTTTPVQFDPAAWYRTLDRYLEFRPQRMYLTHYGMVEQVEQLAQDLRQRLESYVEIAEACRSLPNRLRVMETRIAESTYSELRQLGCQLPAAACKGLLSMDIELNTKGLEVWLEKTVGNDPPAQE